MQHLARIARFSLIALVWFSAMLGFAMLFTLGLSSPYESLELSPLARTLSTMSLAIVGATMIAAFGWSALRRLQPRMSAAGADGREGGDASFARIG